MAAEAGRFTLIRPLVARGAHIDDSDYLGCTPLHYASRNGMSMAVKELIDAGATLSVTDNTNQTPRDLASRQEHMYTIRVFEGEDPPSFAPFHYHEIVD